MKYFIYWLINPLSERTILKVLFIACRQSYVNQEFSIFFLSISLFLIKETKYLLARSRSLGVEIFIELLASDGNGSSMSNIVECSTCGHNARRIHAVNIIEYRNWKRTHQVNRRLTLLFNLKEINKFIACKIVLGTAVRSFTNAFWNSVCQRWFVEIIPEVILKIENRSVCHRWVFLLSRKRLNCCHVDRAKKSNA